MFYGLLKDTLPSLDDDEEDAGAVDDDKPKVDFNFWACYVINLCYVVIGLVVNVIAFINNQWH